MRVEVLGGVERRRRWSGVEKRRIVDETLAPGAVMAEVARRNGVSKSLVFSWRRAALTVENAGAPFAPVRIAAPGSGAENPALAFGDAGVARPLPADRSGRIEIGFGANVRVKIEGAPDAQTLAKVIDALSAAERRR